MFAVAGGANGPLPVQMIREGIVDRLDFRIVQELVIGAVGLGDGKFLGNGFGLFEVARGNRVQFDMLTLQHGGKYAAGGNARGAKDAPFYFSGHAGLRSEEGLYARPSLHRVNGSPAS